MAEIGRVHGIPATGGFYGMQGALVVIDYSGKFTNDGVVSGTDPTIVQGGYSKAVRALEQVASVIWLGDNSNTRYFSAIVDLATFNTGSGATTSGAYGALADALTSEIGSGTAGTYQSGTAVYTTLKGDGTWAA